MRPFLAVLLLSALLQTLVAQQNVFQPFTYEWPAANGSRLASGAPGPQYWQQQADYDIQVELDEPTRMIRGTETVTYHNNSPHTLNFLWLQVDQQSRTPGACAQLWQMGPEPGELFLGGSGFNSRHRILHVKDAAANALPHAIVETSMRIDLPTLLLPGQQFTFSVAWEYELNNAKIEGRSGYEPFPDGHHIFEAAQWFPRMCVYDDTKGWQNRPFYGPAEFALEFGNYTVSITLPADHLVAATGTLTNAAEVLTPRQRARLDSAMAMPGRITVVATAAEARQRLASPAPGAKKTWRFRAEKVRDFAWASSRRYIWDASSVDVEGTRILAQSIYPPEALGLWDKVATHAVMHTLSVYSRMSVPYPWPHATAVNGAVWGMEYPMMAFCGGRPDNGTVPTEETRQRTISVIIHEVGHNFFPMVINSDERRWAWMDEGLNSFVQSIAEQEWEEGYPSRRGFPALFGNSIEFADHDPIMTNPESITMQGKISYEKTAAGLAILRETVMGRQQFDFAFREYARRWAFRHPEPWDFFRTLQDAGGLDLEWFWRSWFYGTGNCDMALTQAILYNQGAEQAKTEVHRPLLPLTRHRNQSEAKPTYTDQHPELRTTGYPYRNAPFDTETPLLPDSHGTLITKDTGTFTAHFTIQRNGIPMPVPFLLKYADGTAEVRRLPAQIWMRGNDVFHHVAHAHKPISYVVLDPHGELPDIDRENDTCPMELR